MTVAPFGSWASPIGAAALTEGTLRLSDLAVHAGRAWWLERRPDDDGRQVVVSAGSDGVIIDHTPPGSSVRTTVHEYGGAPFTVVGDDTVVFSELADQRLWSVSPGAEARPLTPAPPQASASRYADARHLPGGDWVVCVRERHHGPGSGEVENDLVAISLTGDGTTDGTVQPVPLVGGQDFFAAPRPSPDGTRLAWLAWDHPDMPWDGTELWVADLSGGRGDGPPVISNRRRVAGGPDDSISQPRWSPDTRLHWVSDHTGWWNLYAEDGSGARPVAPLEGEFTRPDWVFGQTTYDFLADGRMVAAWSAGGIDHLGIVDPSTGELSEVSTSFTRLDAVVALGDSVVAIAASATEAATVVTITLDGVGIAAGTGKEANATVLRRSRAAPTDQAGTSVAEAITFASTDGRSAHAYWYPPTNPDHVGPAGSLPPLVVLSHGGPTSAASPAFDLSVQFWTSRGLGVVDVDYGGSSGYGRAYRRSLDGAWGVVDVDDCEAAAAHLADRGLVDRDRMVIRGSSAGGFTTLCALTFRHTFAAGASLYGIADLTTLASDTHKFESRYLDRLVGPWPEAADRYRRRSPIHHAAQLACPVIVFQGLDDRVVPPDQAEVLVAALRAKGLPVAYLTFAGEQHGFRRAETIRRVAEAELSFYGQVLGFTPSGPVPAVEIENLRL
ncbi:MAG: prolyl oligopeptidase family serine peptidase [Acidimicrobiales bacterium]